MVEHAGAADDGGHADRDLAQAVFALLERGDGEELAAVEGDGVDDLGDGDADGPAGAALAADDFGAAGLGAVEELGLGGRAEDVRP